MSDDNKSETKVFLSNFKSCQLAKLIDQAELLKYTSWLMATAICINRKISSKEEANKIFVEINDKIKKFGVSEDLINKRQFLVIPEKVFSPSSMDVDKLPLLHQNLFSDPNGAPINVRMNFFREKAGQAFDALYLDEHNIPNDLIHVTCAGYLSPSPAQEYVAKRKWYESQVTHSYHMGCYGAFPAVKMACGFIASSYHSLSSKKQQVDIVHTEFLSTHLNVNDINSGNIVNMTLFGDGFIKYSAYPEDEFRRKNIPGLKLIANHEEIIPDSLQEMTWIPGPHQFDMFLSKNVPLVIGENVVNFVKKLCQKAGFSFDEMKNDLIYAIHPGGPKILNYIKDILAISDEQIKYSKKIFKQNGNMSSATVPHIWKEILESNDVEKGKIILSMGFGPGLTAIGFVLEKA